MINELPTLNNPAMKLQLKIEEFAQFLAALYFLVIIAYSPWWVYLILLIGPDISMLGYLFGPRVGAISYNIFHHKGVALAVLALGLFVLHVDKVMTVGVILYGHASMDRIFGYGLKYSDSFHHTHLGWIGGTDHTGPPATDR